LQGRFFNVYKTLSLRTLTKRGHTTPYSVTLDLTLQLSRLHPTQQHQTFRLLLNDSHNEEIYDQLVSLSFLYTRLVSLHLVVQVNIVLNR